MLQAITNFIPCWMFPVLILIAHYFQPFLPHDVQQSVNWPGATAKTQGSWVAFGAGISVCLSPLWRLSNMRTSPPRLQVAKVPSFRYSIPDRISFSETPERKDKPRLTDTAMTTGHNRTSMIHIYPDEKLQRCTKCRNAQITQSLPGANVFGAHAVSQEPLCIPSFVSPPANMPRMMTSSLWSTSGFHFSFVTIRSGMTSTRFQHG